jgi:hypothetical protein
MNMHELAKPKLDAETIRRFASDWVLWMVG